MASTAFLPPQAGIPERIYVVINNFISSPLCIVCGALAPFRGRGMQAGYASYCSSACSNRSKKSDRNAIRKSHEYLLWSLVYKTKPLSFSRDELKQWILKTCVASQFGKIWHWKTFIPELATLIYLTSFLNNDVSIGERLHCILQDIVDVPCCSCGNTVRFFNGGYKKFCSLTCPAAVQDAATRASSYFNGLTDIEKTRISQKRYNSYLQTVQDRYGVDNIKYIHIPTDVRAALQDANWLKEQHHTFKKPFTTIAAELHVSESYVGTTAKKLGIETKYQFGAKQEEIVSFFREQGELVEVNNRKLLDGKELDIFLPQRNIAVEFDGVYWHSFNRKETAMERSYHQNKTLAAALRGITLYHVFETEWDTSIGQNIWKSIWNNTLGKSRTVYARKCEPRILTYEEHCTFLKLNHIHGYTPAKYAVGLFHEGELVSAMTFGVPRFNKKFNFEIIRMCSKLGMSVTGGASKMLRFFERLVGTQITIISYADLRYATGKLYEKLGFTELKITKPNYYYWKIGSNSIAHRLKFQKHKLSGLLETFDPSLTEAENMFANGYRRIWDCGHKVFGL